MTDTVLSPSPFQVTIWQPGHAYSPGDVVQPTTTVSAGASPPNNPDFSVSLTGWTASANFSWAATPSYNSNGGSASVSSGHSGETLANQNQVAVTVGQTINALCYGGGSSLIASSDNVFVTCELLWYDATHTLIHTTTGGPVNVGSVAGIVWWQCKVSDTAPTGSAYCAVGVRVDNPGANPVYVDAFYWDYIVPNNSASGGNVAYFTNISSGVAVSGSAEPDWTNGGSNVGNVVDGGITWARGVQETIQWICEHFCQSGNSEPAWGLTVGGVTPDGYPLSGPNISGFDWVARTPQILDANCPQSKYVAIGSSHIFAGDIDIVRFSAVTNPLDWTAEADAGFLPTGLQNYGANPVAAVGLYRSNLIVFNSEGMQMWQLDEDPGNMNLLDAIPIGSTYQKALAPMNDDLFFLAAQGVRTIGISIGSGNLMSGDVGMPIDPIVQDALKYAKTNNIEPLGIYYPSYGQYWLVIPGYVPPSTGNPAITFRAIATSGPYSTGDSIFVYTRSRQGEVGAWSRYVVPFAVSGFFFNGDDLCIRSGDDVLKIDANVAQDFSGDNYNGVSRASYFPWAVQWNYLDCGPVGLTKKFDTMDIACSQNTAVTVEIGFDQTNPLAFTTPFNLPADSIPGMQIPIPIMGPSISIRLSGTTADPATTPAWQVDAVNVYVQDQAVTS